MNLEEAKNLIRKEEKTRGETIAFFINYIKKKEGEEGVNKIEERLREMGVEIDIKKINIFGWIEEGYSVIIILLAKELFGWSSGDVFKMGEEEPKNSFIVKVLMKYLLSIEKVFQEAPVYWRKFYNFGRLESVELNEEGGYVILRLHDYNYNEAMCDYFGGFIQTMTGLAVKKEDILVEETECLHKGGEYHEYKIKWKH